MAEGANDITTSKTSVQLAAGLTTLTVGELVVTLGGHAVVKAVGARGVILADVDGRETSVPYESLGRVSGPSGGPFSIESGLASWWTSLRPHTEPSFSTGSRWSKRSSPAFASGALSELSKANLDIPSGHPRRRREPSSAA